MNNFAPYQLSRISWVTDLFSRLQHLALIETVTPQHRRESRPDMRLKGQARGVEVDSRIKLLKEILSLMLMI